MRKPVITKTVFTQTFGDVPVSCLNLSVKAANFLENGRIYTMNDLYARIDQIDGFQNSTPMRQERNREIHKAFEDWAEQCRKSIPAEGTGFTFLQKYINDDKVSDFAINMGSCRAEEKLLLKYFPPSYQDETKKEYYEKARSVFAKQNNIITASRWRFNSCKYLAEMEVPLNKKLKITFADGYFNYADDADEKLYSVYYMNFADCLLFGFYDASNFSQDEIQTLEMPLLPSMMLAIESLKDNLLKSLTAEKKKPTPWIFENIPQWILVNTAPVLDDGTSVNFYGRDFRNASRVVIEKGLSVLKPDESCSVNIICARAPTQGHNEFYTKEDMAYFLSCALAAFGGSVKISSRPCKIHTGNWGTGAFGNNLEASYLVQLIAGAMCGVAELVFHKADAEVFTKARHKFDAMPDKIAFNYAVSFLQEQHYRWGCSNGQ
ncbi:MAG: hypothetical protein SPJ89_09245 [Treponema sp.]|nr:poly(ADP-ribose) glycohydrolase [Spirochaetia bacterium]MDD7459797.1 hypothetical protein [Spirochaetales bacterium]MDY5812151.1 hypothetical protein [Treponema sp.]